MKHVPAPKKKRGMDFDEDDPEDDEGETGLYAEFQTEVYVPPPVVEGRVPKNSFGNIDIYVPSMVPQGGTHVPRKDHSLRAANFNHIFTNITHCL